MNMTTKTLLEVLNVLYAQISEGQVITIRTKSGAVITHIKSEYGDCFDDEISTCGPFVTLTNVGTLFLLPDQVESIYI